MRILATTVACVLVMAGAMLYAAGVQRRSAERNYREVSAAKQSRVDMLARERDLLGYAATRATGRLQSYMETDVRVDAELARARTLSAGRERELRLLAVQQTAEDEWEDGAEAALEAPSKRLPAVVDAGAGARRRALDRFLAANDDYQAVLERRRRSELKAAGLIPVALTLVLGLLFGGAGVALLARNRRVQAARRAAAARATASSEGFARTQERFREALQVASDQGEAHRLLVGHVERWVPGTRAVLLNRNNSEDRLEAATALADGSQLAAALEGARPRSCLAVRLSRRYDTGPDSDEVLECELCGRLPSPSSCRPLLVGGQVIGSVLAVHEHTPDAMEDERIDRSVEQAAPVLANLRNLAIAEARAATDALTGLANRRALDDTLKRLVAHAGRTLTPLSLVLMDLDKFKRINDMHGHERGDEVLAAVGALLGKALRASDVAGRSGGEEFLVLLPDTDREGAARAAETVRLALHALAVPGLEEPVTASFGVASYPEDATDAVTLLRACDRALYAAKRDGRDRVALAEG